MFRESKNVFQSPTELPENTRDNQVETLHKELAGIKQHAIESRQLIYDQRGNFEYALAPNGEKSNLDEKQWLEIRSSTFKEWFGNWERYSSLKDNTDRTEEENVELSDLSPNVSKIVDENGEPTIAYHGTQIEFDQFRGFDYKRHYKKYSGTYFGANKEKVFGPAGLEETQEFADGKFKGTGKFQYQENIERDLQMAEDFKRKYKQKHFFLLKKKYLKLYKNFRRRAREIKPTILDCYLRATNPLMIDNMANGRDGNYGPFENDVLLARENGFDAVIWNNTYDTSSTPGTVLNVFEPTQIKSAERNNGLFEKDNVHIYE
ncbi:MAG: hypothetical protein AAB445_00920 [Patescibacteria group bacterium]